MPFVQRVLTVDNGRLQGIAVIQEFHQITLLSAAKAMQAPVIKEVYINAGQLFQPTEIGALFARNLECFQLAMQAVIEGLEVFQTGFVSQRTSDIAFTDTGGSSNEDILSPSDPLVTGQVKHPALVHSARRAVVQIGHTGLDTELGHLQSPDQSPIFAYGFLMVNHKAETTHERHDLYLWRPN